jgi:hypothetical protein
MDAAGDFLRPKRSSYAISLALTSLVAANLALPQATAAPQAPTKTGAVATESDVASVVITSRRV